jgi:S-formylglutathione hydrolase FrmB
MAITVKFFLLLALSLSASSAALALQDTLTMFSVSMQKSSPLLVVTPDRYHTTADSFPVLYLLHGYGGDYLSWSRLDQRLQDKANLYNMIIVCPDGGKRSWYLDSPVDPAMKYESHIINEVVPYVDSVYRTIRRRNARAISGLSMGGHGGLYLASRHSDVFGAAGSSSGGVDIRQFTESWDLKEKILGDTICCKSNWEIHTVYNVIERLKPGELSLIIDCGLDDFFLGVNRKLHQKLLLLGIEHDYIERPGAHDSAYWLNSIDFQLLYFSKFFTTSLFDVNKVRKQRE